MVHAAGYAEPGKKSVGGAAWARYSRSPKKSRTPTVAKEFQIGLCGVVEADLELFCNSWSAGFLGERLYDTRSVRSFRAAGILRDPRIYAVIQKRGPRGGHLPQGSVGDQLVFRTRLRGVGRCQRRGKTWPDSTVASLSTAASRSRRTRMSIKPAELELIVSKFALEIVPQDQHAARSM